MPVVALDEAPFLAEVERIVSMGEQRSAPLRVCGSVGLYYRLRDRPEARALFLFRDGAAKPAPVFKDLDLAGWEKHSSRVYKLFVRELGYREDRETNALFGMYRNIYFHPAFSVDVFFDVLRFSHEIALRQPFPGGVTLSVEDLMLSKLQIHQTTPRDLVDLAAGASAFPPDRLDRDYLARVLGDDWGFWYDAQQNLEHAAAHLDGLARVPEPPPAETLSRARESLRAYRQFLDSIPKTRRWEKRRLRGTAEPWFEEVDEVH